MLDRQRIETLSNEELIDLLPILRIAEHQLYRDVKAELGMRAARICYEGCGGS